MREKELRLALVCYGGVSLAVYMHGISKEIWHLARASRAFHAREPEVAGGTAAAYRDLLAAIEAGSGLRLRVLVDILSGASAGGINAVFLAQAIETGQSLEPLTALWLEKADAEVLQYRDDRPVVRSTKFWAAPILWALWRRGNDSVRHSVAPETREEVRRKLASFVRARWFSPPFDGARFTELLLRAFDAMAAEPCGPPLLPARHPLDLFVSATDFTGHPVTLRLNSPPSVTELEHRMTLDFAARGDRPRDFADAAELVFAARATASFPGAFPAFTVRELDAVLARNGRSWPGRADFLRRIMPQQFAVGRAEDAALIDGSVLANAPFGQAASALPNRPARREVHRRFVYIEPTPRAVARNGPAAASPGFFRAIFGAISTIPREQPIRDELDAIARRAQSIDRLGRVIAAMRPVIDAAIEDTIGQPLFLDRPTPARLASWRARMHRRAAQGAGFAYVAYGRLKLSAIITERAALIVRLTGGRLDAAAVETRLHAHLAATGADMISNAAGRPVDTPATVAFLRAHDVAFRIRRLRFLARRLAEHQADSRDQKEDQAPDTTLMAVRDLCYDAIARYTAQNDAALQSATLRRLAGEALSAPGALLDALAAASDLGALDLSVERDLAPLLAALPLAERRRLLRAYVGFPLFDIATLPILQDEGLDEYDPIKVDRISPDDAVALRPGGAAATLKGIEFNTFGAFFSRAYRENDYLWGRLHAADRLVDIVLSAAPPSGGIDALAHKRCLFTAILDEEDERLPAVAALIAELKSELARASVSRP